LNQLYGRFDLLGVLLAEGDLLFYAVPVSNAGLATYVAVANSVYIRLAAVVFDLCPGRLAQLRVPPLPDCSALCCAAGTILIGRPSARWYWEKLCGGP
jgi:hypothetical protein